ncbi:hypothetical protein [Gloeothece verrucosa]|nr:hypothetical protein [Gloeothece verrucosa]
MKKLGRLTTSILLTMSLAMYARYFSDSVANSQKPKFSPMIQPIALKND